jgi:type I restriction enzyme S subunit
MNAIQQLLTDHIDIWTAADTEKKSGRGRSSGNAASVYGIRKLRELILELAVRGKLVPQDANDEPASELLKRIQAEKAKLIAEGKIKKDKSLLPITDSDKPFALPQSWVWARFGEIYNLEYGDNLPSEKRSNSGEYPVYGSNGVVGSHNVCFVKSPCIVVGRKGSAGALNLSLSTGCCVTDVAYYCIPPKYLDLIFSFKLFHTLGLDFLGKGIKPGLNRNEAYELPIAIPPLAEQHRIVAKVDELMVLCDQLETQHSNAAVAHEQLVSQLLATLTLSQSAAEFSANWQRIAAHFDTLFTTEASIEVLKQTLLQLAVMGKLVPQDPNDEPASELLKRIQAEKARLVAEGKIKKDKPLPPITDEEKPFVLPQGWEWTALASISLVNPRNSAEDNLPASFVPMTMIGTRFNSLHDQETRLWKEIKQGFTHFAEGDIGVAKITPCFENSKACVFSGLRSGVGAGTTELHIVRPLNATLAPRFVLAYLKSPQFLLVGETKMTGTAGQKRLPKEFVESNPFPLPPLAEQHRIVAKIDELVTLCDQLKSRITDSNQLQKKMADVLVEQAISH